jgi:hypothetical protein
MLLHVRSSVIVSENYLAICAPRQLPERVLIDVLADEGGMAVGEDELGAAETVPPGPRLDSKEKGR